MKASRTIFSLLLSVALLLCGLSSGCTSDKEATSSYAQLPVLRIGSDDYPPFFSINEDSTYIGVDVEIATEACRRMGYKPQFVLIPWQDKDSYLSSGKLDCLWGSFSMNGREDRYYWAGPYLNSLQVIAVAKDAQITKLADLEGKRVAVQSTSKPDEIFSGQSDVAVPNIKQLYTFSDIDYVIAALQNGYVDAVAGHESVLTDHMKSSNGSFRLLDDELLEVQLGVAFYKDGDRTVADKLTKTLKEMNSDGFIADVLRRHGIYNDKLLTGDRNA